MNDLINAVGEKTALLDAAIRCHQEGSSSVHKNRESDLHIKRIAQMKAMEAYQWDTEDFIREFGRNYLED